MATMAGSAESGYGCTALTLNLTEAKALGSTGRLVLEKVRVNHREAVGVQTDRLQERGHPLALQALTKPLEARVGGR